MRNFYLLLVFMASIIIEMPQLFCQTTKQVTFWLDASSIINNNSFNPETDFLDMPGSMNGWEGFNSGNEYLLTPAETPGFYQITLNNLYVDTVYWFKFRINGDWNTCELPGVGNDRNLTVKSWVSEFMCVWDVHGVHENFLQSGFSSNKQIIETGQTVNFYDNSLGNATTWLWQFEGGNPATSTNQNPVVTYSSAGIFKVSLKVTSTTNTNQKEIDGYLRVMTSLPDTLWKEDFEGDWTQNWHTDYGTWEAGIPTSGPGSAFSGQKCAATNLSGNYNDDLQTRWIRHTKFTVPNASLNPRLCFWQWFSSASYDYCQVQIKVDGNAVWTNLNSPVYGSGSGVWSKCDLQLSSYSGQLVEIAFLYSSEWPNVDLGWYVDDVSVVFGNYEMVNTEDFEVGFHNWYSDCGTWEIGKPCSGPCFTPFGDKCAATVLNGNYFDNTCTSRLISPYMTVPNNTENPRLRFWHWFTFSSYDYGKVQVKRKNSAVWEDVSNQLYGSSSGVWTYNLIDLCDFSGDIIQIGFLLYSEWPNTSSGWYVDKVFIETGEYALTGNIGWENGFENWYVDAGTWNIGTPTYGPSEAFKGNTCAGTNVAGEYWDDACSSRLISPYVVVPGSAQNPRLTFWNWFSFSSYDYGKVQYRVKNSESWLDLSANIVGTSSNIWSFVSIDLSALSGSEIQIGFLIYSEWPNTSSGWYLDEININQANSKPIISFSANLTEANISNSVSEKITFTDHSANSPTSWNWTFSPNNVTFVESTAATSQNPKVKFTQPGQYSVTLTATNAYGSGIKTYQNYITVNQSIPDPNMGIVAYYPFNGDYLDYSGNGNHAQKLGNAGFSAGVSDQCLYIGNNATDAVSLPISILNNVGDFGIACWVKLNTIHTTGTLACNELFSGARESNNNVFQINYWENSWHFDIEDNPDYNLNTPATASTWQHLAISRRGGQLECYVNGVFQINLPVSEALTYFEAGGLLIGQEQDCLGGCFAQNQSLAGNVDEVYIYCRALEYAEILELYAGGYQLQANFSADPTSGNNPLTVQFNDLSNGLPLTYNWDFGDMTIQSSEQNPVHTYETPGDYSVTLTITNNTRQSTMIQSELITVYSPFTTDELFLNAGWNLVSFDISPTFDTPEFVFSQLIATGNLIMVTGFQNQQGVFYNPAGPPFLNTLQQLIDGEGYWVKVQNATSFALQGEDFPANFSIDLTSGWNLIGYWPQETTTPAQAFATLISAGILQMVTGYDQGGQFFNPSGPPFLNTLTEIKNGFGYWIKVSENFENFSYSTGSWDCGELLFDPRDGQTYETVQIGNQCWMAENLNTGIMISAGTSAQTNNGIIEKYCYGDAESNCVSKGAFYQWDELMNYSAIESGQGICPTGWHVPSESEWCTMANGIDPIYNCGYNWNGNNIGINLKPGGTSGFDALYTGSWHNGFYWAMNNGIYYWCSTLSGEYGIFFHMNLDAGTSQLLYKDAFQNTFGFSVRCLKD